MARIYKRTDRISVKIGDVTVKLAPLSLDQKTEIQQAMFEGRANTDLKQLSHGIALSIKYALKGVSGIEDSDGPYHLQFEDEQLTDACVDDLLNMELTPKLTMICAAMVNGIPKEFTDKDGKLLEGVQVLEPAKADSKN